jgi:small subunit ribosomal protein S17
VSKQQLEGTVVSDKMAKTVVVAVTRRFEHPRAGKVVQKTRKYLAHDENGRCRVGDIVRMVETRPLSRRKRWRVVEVVRTGAAV